MSKQQQKLAINEAEKQPINNLAGEQEEIQQSLVPPEFELKVDAAQGSPAPPTSVPAKVQTEPRKPSPEEENTEETEISEKPEAAEKDSTSDSPPNEDGSPSDQDEENEPANQTKNLPFSPEKKPNNESEKQTTDSKELDSFAKSQNLSIEGTSELFQSLSQQTPFALAASLTTFPQKLAIAQENEIQKSGKGITSIQQPTGLESKAFILQSNEKPVHISTPELKPFKRKEPPLMDITHPLGEKKLGKVPHFKPNGSADPDQNEEIQQKARQAVNQQMEKASKSHSQDFGETQLAPDLETELLSTQKTLPKPPEFGKQFESVPELDPSIQNKLGPQAKKQFQGKLNPEFEKQRLGQEEFDTKSEEEKEKSLGQIKAETGRVKANQTILKEKSQQKISLEKDKWKSENEKVKTEFDKSVKKDRQKINTLISGESKRANQAITYRYALAEKKVIAEEKKAEKKAKEEEEKGWVTKMWDKVKAAIAMVWNGFKNLTQTILQKAKKYVCQTIEIARYLIQKAVQAFGEGLKILVATALAAYPEIAERFIKTIDTAIQITISGLNKLAEGLKTFAVFILDTWAEAIKLLTQGLFALSAKVTEAIFAIGEIIKMVIEGLVGLSGGIQEMPKAFPGVMLEEAIGIDPSAPLVGIERTDSEIEAFQKMLEKRAGNVPATSLRLEVGEENIAEKPVLNDNDISLEGGPDVFSQELLTSLPQMEDGEVMELGGSPDPETTKNVQKNTFAGKEPESTVDSNQSPTVPQAEESSPDFAKMGDDEKLQYHLNKMDEVGGQPDPKSSGGEKKKPKAEQPKGPSTYEDLVPKTGKLGMGKRLAFTGKQMVKGISGFWKAQKVTIIAALMGILVVGGVIAFFTGGAGLLAVLQVLMQVLAIYFAADAIVRIKNLLQEFADNSWAGKPKVGGKKLAQALAVIISEFVLDYILMGAGKLIGKAKKSLKGSKKSLKMGKKTGRKAKKGGKAFKKVRKAGKVISKKGRYAITGLKKGWTKGKKSLAELKDMALGAFGFKRVWIEKHGKRVEMWGSFNPKVLLSSGEVIDASIPNRTQGESIVGKKLSKNDLSSIDLNKMSPKDIEKLKNSKGGVVVAGQERGNPFMNSPETRKTRKADPNKTKEMSTDEILKEQNKIAYDDLAEMDTDPDRLKAITSGSSTYRNPEFAKNYFESPAIENLNLSENAKRAIKVHHVIPNSLRDLEGIQDFLKKMGFNIDELENAIGLPGVKMDDLQETINKLKEVNGSSSEILKKANKRLGFPENSGIDKLEELRAELKKIQEFQNASGHAGGHPKYIEDIKGQIIVYMNNLEKVKNDPTKIKDLKDSFKKFISGQKDSLTSGTTHLVKSITPPIT